MLAKYNAYKNMARTQEKMNRKCPWGIPDIGLNKQRLRMKYFKCTQRVKRDHVQITKENHVNSVSANKEYQ